MYDAHIFRKGVLTEHLSQPNSRSLQVVRTLSLTLSLTSTLSTCPIPPARHCKSASNLRLCVWCAAAPISELPRSQHIPPLTLTTPSQVEPTSGAMA
jgi:hypothetical protein